MLLNNRPVPKAPLTRSHLAHGFKLGGRQIGHRWFEDPAKGGDPPAKPDPKPETTTDEPLGDAGKAALQKERDAREAAEKEAKRLKKIVDDADAAKAKADEDDAKAKGEWEKLAAERETERDAATADVTRLTSENDQLKAAMKTGVDAQWKALPERIRKHAEKFLPEDNITGRWTYLNDPDTKKWADEESGAGPASGNGINPKAAGGQTPSTEQTTNELRAMRGYRPRAIRSG